MLTGIWKREFILISFFFLIVSLSTVLYSSLYGLEEHQHHQQHWQSRISRKDKRVAVIYARPTFHEEIVSVVACLLHKQGFYTVVYVGSGVQFYGHDIPFTNRRKEGSKLFYGHCVDEFITIPLVNIVIATATATPLVRYVSYPVDVMALITYPMKIAHNVDEYALSLLKNLNISARSKILCIVHRSHRLTSMLDLLRSIVPLSQLYFLFLSEHSYTNAINKLTEGGNVSDCILDSKLNIDYFYPVLPDLHTIDSVNNEIKIGRYDSDIYMSIQGNLGGSFSNRRSINEMIECINAYSKSSTAGKDKKKVHLNLIGRVHKKLEIPSHKESIGTIRIFSNLHDVEYYKAISQSHYLLAALPYNNSDAKVDNGYYTYKSTSTVGAALSTRIPIIGRREFISLYPCLRDSKMHRTIASGDECTAVVTALSFNHSQYILAKKEIVDCSNRLYLQSIDVFKKILQ